MKTTMERVERDSPSWQGKRARQEPTAPSLRRDEETMRESWARKCAMAGASVWAGTAVLARMGIARVGSIELMFLFAPLVIVPLGLELGRLIGAGGRIIDVARKIQPVGALLAVVAMTLPPGRNAGVLSTGWLVVCLMLAGDGLTSLVRPWWGDADTACPELAEGSVRATRIVRATLAVARIDLAVGGAWLVASRLGMRPMRIQEPIGLLTAVHFHFAGFATATIAAATLAFAERRAIISRFVGFLIGIVAAVTALPYLVAAGFVISPGLKMVAAILFSTCVAVLAVLLQIFSQRINDTMSRVLLQIASGSVFAGMLFAAAWAVVDFAGKDTLTIPQMVRTHGILNAVGFCLPGLLGWLVEISERG